MTLDFQFGERHLLVAQAIGKELLVQSTDSGLAPSNRPRASSSFHQAPMTGLRLKRESMLGVIRQVGFTLIRLNILISFCLSRGSLFQMLPCRKSPF